MIKEFVKKWTLPLSMITGAAAYFAYTSIHALDCTHQLAHTIIGVVQPLLIFSMLFLTFLKITPSQLHLQKWHMWGLLLQLGVFVLCTVMILLIPESNWKPVIEGVMICMICPTATAAAVVTGKLGGNQATLTTYTILINLSVAIAVPTVVPLIHQSAESSFISDAVLIMSKIFPLLFCPFLIAIFVRHYIPSLAKRLTSIPDMAFYLWVVALAIAIAVTVRSIVHSQCPWIYQFGIAVTSLMACIIQFACGRWIGKLYQKNNLYNSYEYNEMVTVAQSLGQKNTVFAIWMGYTFFTPVTSIAGGFYSVWHNLYNSYQLAHREDCTPKTICK